MGHLLENLKETKINEIIEKWEGIGFLSVKDINNKQNVALACELTALYLLENTEKYNEDITTLIFPVIIRIFRKTEENLTIENILKQVIEITKEFSDNLESVDRSEWSQFVDGKDLEAEFLVNFCENYK